MQIAPGIHWLRMPLPGRLDHVNLWILEEADGWTLVDCGLNNQTTASVWAALFDGMLSGRPVKSIIVTHAHVDHVGYLGGLIERTDAPLIMTITEYLTVALRMFETPERMAEQSLLTISRCGTPPEETESMIARRRDVRGTYSGIPPHYTRAIAGHPIVAGGRLWQVATFGGHSPEMLTLFDPVDQILIAGDQVLTQITPSINVSPTEPSGDPLSIFYESFAPLKALPAETLVLPSHGMPFYGLQARIDQISDHHDQRLDKILGFVEGDPTSYEIALKTFERAMATTAARQALAETLAHLHYLQKQGRVTSYEDASGIVHYRRP
ncbi:MBL fold metallo-hydrolase [Corticibacterium sp. UT-5YL-CI-8]|nr:MBL fold metallo-hydrolase [Tianweitania sp. UT-5YL-CI-8]